MNEVYEQILSRNGRETLPFRSVYEANATLLNQVDALQVRCEVYERELSSLRQDLQDAAWSSATATSSSSSSLVSGGGVGGAAGSRVSSAAAAAALKNEARLRDKLEKIQEEYNAKLKSESEDKASALKTAKELSDAKDQNAAHEATITSLREEIERREKTVKHLNRELDDARSRTSLAEKQYEGLKETIRVLQEENDKVKKENRQLEERLVSEKGKTVDEMNTLTEMVESLKKEVDMLRSYKQQEDSRRSWFGGGGKSKDTPGKDHAKDGESSKSSPNAKKGEVKGRKFGVFGVVPPSEPKITIAAHSTEGNCVRYDDTGTDLVATASSDSTVKVWDTKSGLIRATLRGTTGHTFLGCDIKGGLVAGAGSDKTCRVWNLRTERMIHHLVGHAHKITCVRLFSSGHSVITGSADRSLKVWDITRQTYRQTTTLRHSSTSNCVDIASDSNTAVSGHLDGGLRFWDIRSGERTVDIPGMHEGGITSVHFCPTDSTQVLTNSLDSTLKIVDARTGTAQCTFRHGDFRTMHGWSSAVFSPDGRYAAAASNSTGEVFVWDASGGTVIRKLPGHKAGACGIDWGRGGDTGQQVASVDRKGVMILWA